MKKFKYFVLCFFMIFFMTGCFNKKSISSNEFKSIMSEKGFDVQDATKQFSDYDYVKRTYIALNDDFQIEFYELSDEEKAKGFYETNKSIFESSKESGYSQFNNSVGNHSKYTLKTGGKYKVVSRIDNTVIYLNVLEEYKDEIKDILKDLGY